MPGSTPDGLAHVNPLLKIPAPEAGHYQDRRQAGEKASPDHGDSRDTHLPAAARHGRHHLAQLAQPASRPRQVARKITGTR
jgi:hypothetical protein